VVNAVDIDGTVQRVDVKAVVERVDVDTRADRIDVNAPHRPRRPTRLLAGLEIDSLVLLVNVLVRQLGLNAIVGRVDVNAIAGRSPAVMIGRCAAPADEHPGPLTLSDPDRSERRR
jgi:hypothetical protein